MTTLSAHLDAPFFLLPQNQSTSFRLVQFLNNGSTPLFSQPLIYDHLPSLTAAVKRSSEALQLNQHFDVVVVGAGITGAGVARESARRGWKTLLLEKNDFASGTSNFSSKMVHGGLRYLALGQWQLTREAAQAREQLLQHWPDLVRPMPYLFPSDSFKQRLQLTAGLWLYHLLAGAQSKHRPVHFSQPQLQQLLPGLTLKAPHGAKRYFDAICDDSALVLRTLQEAINYGANLQHYCPVSRIKDHGEQVVVQTDSQSIHAKVVINATGVWADDLTKLPKGQSLRPQRGSHLLLPWKQLPLSCAITLQHPRDGRVVFVYPWFGCTVIGTTDLDHLADKQQPCRISQKEQQYLLELLPLLGCHRQPEILASWSGLRPIIGENNQQNQAPSAVSREHLVWQQQRIISVSGGKLTTFEAMAQDTLEAASTLLPSAILKQAKVLQATPNPNSVPFGNSKISVSELEYWCQHGAIVQLSDLLIRRTRLGWLLGRSLESQQPALRQLCQPLLGWSDNQWQQQWQNYWQEFQQQYAAHPPC